MADWGDGDGQAPDERVLYDIVLTDEEGTVVERLPVRRGQDTRVVDPGEAAGNETDGG